MWSDWLVFCDCGFSVSALWCPLSTPTVLLGFLLPWTWGISSRLLQQSATTTPYIRWGVSPHGHPSWPWTWSSSFQPSCAHAATAPWWSPDCLSPCQRLHPRSWERAKSQEQTHSTRESKDVLLKVEVKNAGGKTIRNPLVTNIVLA